MSARNDRALWSPEDDRRLRSGVTAEKLARELGRTARAVSSRRRRSGASCILAPATGQPGTLGYVLTPDVLGPLPAMRLGISDMTRRELIYGREPKLVTVVQFAWRLGASVSALLRGEIDRVREPEPSLLAVGTTWPDEIRRLVDAADGTMQQKLESIHGAEWAAVRGWYRGSSPTASVAVEIGRLHGIDIDAIKPT